MPEDVVALYDDGIPEEGELIYMPKSAWNTDNLESQFAIMQVSFLWLLTALPSNTESPRPGPRRARSGPARIAGGVGEHSAVDDKQVADRSAAIGPGSGL
jgi:hypothetical protein